MASRTTQGQIVVDPAGGAITVDITNPAAGTADLWDSAAVVDQQSTITIDATGGTFTVAINSGTPTSAVAYNATAATLQAALEATDELAAGDVVVTKASSVFTLEFGGAYVGAAVTVATDAGSLTGGAGTAAVAAAVAASGRYTFPQTITEATTYYCNPGRYTVSLKAHGIEIATERNTTATVDARNIARISPVWSAFAAWVGDAITASVAFDDTGNTHVTGDTVAEALAAIEVAIEALQP